MFECVRKRILSDSHLEAIIFSSSSFLLLSYWQSIVINNNHSDGLGTTHTKTHTGSGSRAQLMAAATRKRPDQTTTHHAQRNRQKKFFFCIKLNQNPPDHPGGELGQTNGRIILRFSEPKFSFFS